MSEVIREVIIEATSSNTRAYGVRCPVRQRRVRMRSASDSLSPKQKSLLHTLTDSLWEHRCEWDMVPVLRKFIV